MTSCSVLSLLLVFFFIPYFVLADPTPDTITISLTPKRSDFDFLKSRPKTRMVICENVPTALASCKKFFADDGLISLI